MVLAISYNLATFGNVMWICHEDILAKWFSGLVGPGHITGIANHILWKDSRLIIIRNHCYYRYIQKTNTIYQILYIYIIESCTYCGLAAFLFPSTKPLMQLASFQPLLGTTSG